MVLVDSSVYIELLRAGRNPMLELAAAFGSTELAGCGIVRCEVLRGMIRPEARDRLASFFDLLIHLAIDHRVWKATEELAWKLDRVGRCLPLPDLIIAVCALRVGAAVLTNDAHFAMVPQLKLASW